jgi:shikimate dehydrogenase
MRKYGLIGKNIEYSFSRAYFKNKFESEQITDSLYVNFDIPTIQDFPKILKTKDLIGLNVTIPYKESVIPYLDFLDKTAKIIGAVNTVKINPDKSLTGYNTDCYGFKKALIPYIKPHYKKALILGTGGASKAVAYALNELDIEYKFVSRTPDEYQLTYDVLSKAIIDNHHIIINCTPLGTFPNIKNCPPIPYQHLNHQHLLFDLIYNPAETAFMKQGLEHGARVTNGLKMLEFQAEKAYEIWNS